MSERIGSWETFIKELNTEVGLSLSDCLSAYYEELTEDYKNKIADFINHCDDWYDIATNAIQQRAKDIYHGNEIAQAIRLVNIFVLFEQTGENLFGLEFRVNFDEEHGCGLKMSENNGTYKVVKIGTGDVSFS